jgi:hypothetical protein
MSEGNGFLGRETDSTDVLRERLRPNRGDSAERRGSVPSRVIFARQPTIVQMTNADGYLEAVHLTDRENINTSRLKHTATVSALLAGMNKNVCDQV